MRDRYFEALLSMAIEEDLGMAGDLSSKSVFKPDSRSKAILVSKDEGVLCGTDLVHGVYERIDPELRVDVCKGDGQELKPGDVVAHVEGSTISILQGERVAINFLGFLSGIATSAHNFQERARAHGRSIILDTRKTLPGYRTLSKYAVRVGGARNHRMGLYDMILIKDNHIDAAGGIEAAVGMARSTWGDKYKIEVECRSLEDVRIALGLGVEWIMLDNMDEALCAACLELPRRTQGSTVFEASGNMNMERVAAYSRLGVDFISVGALTHSVKCFDFSMRMDG